MSKGKRTITARVIRPDGEQPSTTVEPSTTMAERINLVWELTVQCMQWSPDVGEPRLQRSASSLQRPLGKYDYHGKNGFHCVTWMMRAQLGDGAGESLVRILGGKDKDGRSMPRFARFVLKRAKGVEAIAVHDGTQRNAENLAAERFGSVITTLGQLSELRKAAGL